MKLSKTVYLIIFLIFLLIIVLAIQFFYSPKETTSPRDVIKQDNTSRESPFVQTPKMRISSSDITTQPISVVGSVTITFDQPVDNETLSLEITPSTILLPLFDSSQRVLTISPSEAWNFNTTYTLKVSPKTISADGETLDKEYIYTFKTLPYSGI